MSTDDRWVFSFEYICVVLGLDAECVRHELCAELLAFSFFVGREDFEEESRKRESSKARKGEGRSLFVLSPFRAFVIFIWLRPSAALSSFEGKARRPPSGAGPLRWQHVTNPQTRTIDQRPTEPESR